MDNNVGLGEFIRQRRKLVGRTQVEIATEAGIEQGYFTQIERGNRIGSPETILRIGQALGIKPAYKIFALFDPNANLSEEELNNSYLKLPDSLSIEDRKLLGDMLDRMVQLRNQENTKA